MSSFYQLVEHNWNNSVYYGDAAKRITAKFKVLRKAVKHWAKSFSSLQEDISDIHSFIAMLDSVENIRVLSDQERIFWINLKTHLQFLLKQQLAHWKQRERSNG
jgi:hypothetical protein